MHIYTFAAPKNYHDFFHFALHSTVNIRKVEKAKKYEKYSRR